MIVRILAAATIALLLAVQILRHGASSSLAAYQPEQAARWWPGSPSAEISHGMIRIAAASRARQPVPPEVLERIYAAEGRAPLDPQGFLVRGVEAQLTGDNRAAELAFRAAQWRDPRSIPAAYFLADHNLRLGRVQDALRQVGALARLAPGGATTVAPYIATFARDRRNWPLLKEFFRSEPGLRSAALSALAADAGNADAVLALTDPDRQSQRDWLPKLLHTLVQARQYERAHAIWSRLSAVRGSGGSLHDPSFSDRTSPPPFNWSLDSSTVGLAERQLGGRLHVLFYGQQDGVLARQLVLLRPGTYRLTMSLLGEKDRAQALSWNVRCDQSSAPFASIALDAAARGWSFTVPASCPAQWLELSGRSADVSQQSDITIAGLRLTPENPRG
ncbi:MAG TPA: hypothetical protein VM308_01635 [Sphingomicrobium sp.]|nr:hypothetical protein [Sphingomicrobium sp.]